MNYEPQKILITLRMVEENLFYYLDLVHFFFIFVYLFQYEKNCFHHSQFLRSIFHLIYE